MRGVERLASHALSPRPFIPMSRGAPAERGKRARVTSARARRTFPRARARHGLLLRAQTSAAGTPPGQLHLQVNDLSWTEKYHRRDMAEDPCGQPAAVRERERE